MPARIEQRPTGGIGGGLASARQTARRSLMRNHGGGHAAVSNLELFFDLVFVFAITQLSHFLHHHLNLAGLIEGMILFMALWWAWIYTAWVTNWANPDRLPVRLLMLALMLLSLVMAVAMPEAFAGRAWAFVGSYLAIQLGRTLCMAAFFKGESDANALSFLRIACWFGFSALFWLAGAKAGEHARILWWAMALAIEYAGPIAFFRVPGLGRSSVENWDISGSHLAERCSLFIIIALGEGIVVIGSAFAGGAMIASRIAAVVLSFLASALMWWLYFDMGAERGARLISGHEQAGRVARSAYTYLHMPIVAGIVIAAVADALALEGHDALTSRPLILTMCGGMLTFLLGLGLFKRFANTLGNFPLSHTVGVLLFIALGTVAWADPMPATTFAALGVAILLTTAVWEWVSYHGGWMEAMEARDWRIARPLRSRFEVIREKRTGSGQPLD